MEGWCWSWIGFISEGGERHPPCSSSSSAVQSANPHQTLEPIDCFQWSYHMCVRVRVYGRKRIFQIKHRNLWNSQNAVWQIDRTSNQRCFTLMTTQTAMKKFNKERWGEACVCECVRRGGGGTARGGRGWLPAESQRPNENIITTSESGERDCQRDDNSIREKSDN